jgi:ribose transport system substrate-binding protein
MIDSMIDKEVEMSSGMPDGGAVKPSGVLSGNSDGGAVKPSGVVSGNNGGRYRPRIAGVVAVVAALVLSVLAACGPSSGSASGGKLTIAVVPKSIGLFYWGTVHAGAEAAARQLGVNIVWKGTATETDVTGQTNILQDFVTQHVDGIVFAASDQKALVPLVQQANDAKIPILNIDSGISPQSIPLIATDNVKASSEAADELNTLLHGNGSVALLPFVPTAATSVQREQGFTQELAKYAGLKLVAKQYDQSDVNTALSEMQNILNAHPDLSGVFAANEPGVIGTIHALQAANKVGKVVVVGFDNATDEVTALQNGQIQALIVQNPYQIGYQGVENIVKMIHHQSVPQSTDTGATVVTGANMNDPKIHSLLYPPTSQ